MPNINRAVAVFGGCGFIGSALTKALVESHAFSRITVVDDLSTGKVDLLPSDPAVRFIHANAGTTSLRSLGSPDTVYYLCASPYVPDSFDHPETTMARNVATLESFIKTNRGDFPRRFVYASSGEVYGSVAAGCASESEAVSADELTQYSPYAQSRLMAEAALARAATHRAGPTVALRLFNVIGPAATHPYVVPDMISQAVRNGRIEHGNLSAIRDFVWIGDTIDAMLRARTITGRGFVALNVSSGEGWSIGKILQEIGRAVGDADIKHRLDTNRLRPTELTRLVGCTHQARSLLGWQATTPIPTAIARTVKQYLADERWPYETITTSRSSRQW